MALDTYANLQSAIAAWMDRTDLTSVIPDFITLFETTANTEIPLRTNYNLTKTDLTTTANVAQVNLPSDFLEAKTIVNQTNPVVVLTPYTPASLYTLVTTPTTPGPPKGFTFIGGTTQQIELAPIPDQAYTLRLYYYKRVVALSSSNTSNWLLQYFPNLYLFGSLVAAEAYLGTDPRIKMWGDLYDDQLQKLNGSTDRSLYGGTPIRVQVDSGV